MSLPLKPLDVLAAASAVSGHSLQMLLGPRRTHGLARVRHIAYTVMVNECPQYSLTDMGYAIERDPATIRHGTKNAERLMLADSRFADMYRAIIDTARKHATGYAAAAE